MNEFIYNTLSSFGYTHPLHAPFTHLTVGMVIGAFIFALFGKFSKSLNMIMCARYCLALGLVSLIPTALIGYMDWQHFFGGAWLFPFKAKLGLAGLLLILLIITGLLAEKGQRNNTSPVTAFFLCFLCVAGLGYFGGELVYGNKFAASHVPPSSDSSKSEQASAEIASKGYSVFAGNCALCHAVDTTEDGVGPGLKNIFSKETLPVSGHPVSEQTIRELIRNPYENMPPFPNLSDADIDAIIAYLKTV